MARLNIEEDVFGKISKFAQRLGWKDREALGLLSLLWHDSQDEGACQASRDDLVDYCRLFMETPEEQDQIIKALERSKFIERLGDDLFKIRGNEEQIKILNAYKDRMKKARQKKLDKMSGKTDPDPPPDPSPSPEPQAPSSIDSSIDSSMDSSIDRASSEFRSRA